jgi:DNA gyrase subunit A
MIIPEEGGKLLTVSERGFGKRTEVSEFPSKGRAGQGVIGMQCSERNGELVGAVQVFDGDEIMLISNQGTLVRTRTDEISVLSRNTQGVRLIKVAENESLMSVERIAEPEETDEPNQDASEQGETEQENPEQGETEQANPEQSESGDSEAPDAAE